MDKASFFILNIILNSFLAFFTVALIIESVIFLFKIRQGRVAAVLRMVPLLKLPLDICLYDFSKWSYVHGINPFYSEEGTRTLSAMIGLSTRITDWLYLPVNTGIQLSLPGGLTFTIADLIGYLISPILLKTLAGLFIIITLCIVARRLFLYYLSLATLRSLATSSQLSCKKVQNSALSSYIKKSEVKILTSPTLSGSPFVVGLISSAIYISTHLSNNLSEKEYEAILAHEMEHVRYRDGLVRLTLDIIKTVFWWIPTKWLRKRIEEGQEVGCDFKCYTYGIDATDLAAAVCKSAKYSANIPVPIFAHQLAKHTILKRINLLIQPPSMRFKKIRFALSCFAFGIAFLLFLGKFWIF